jgi:glucose/arabinose dehydrogenase
MRIIFFVTLIFSFATPSMAQTTGAIKLAEFATSVDRPVKMVAVGAKEFWVVEQAGSIRRIEGGKLQADAVLNIKDRVSTLTRGGDERGLLGLAIHPKDRTRVFVNYTTREPLRSRVSEFKFGPTTRAIDPKSERVLLEVKQPYSNHNGGEIAFGPDGFLYISLGDGGAAGDPEGNGQNLKSLLGKILRIDVDGSQPYAIPEANPFSKSQDAKPEIFAYGLRNVWRFSFDRASGKLWAADVGQNSYEEVNVIESGKNYGWDIMEASHCFAATSCDRRGLTLPVHEYGRQDGISITGGFVYRGKAIPNLTGKYIFGDFGSGNIWALSEAGNGRYTSSRLLATNHNISSFAEDLEGEIYVLDLSGSIYKMTAP